MSGSSQGKLKRSLGCESHYPIIGNWTVISEDRNHTTWQCPKCGETYTSDKHQGRLEFVPESIKEGRKKYKKELLQPYRQGELSKEYIDAYPHQVKTMIKEGAVTRKQVEKAKNVWYKDI